MLVLLTGFKQDARIKPMKITIDKQKCIGCGTCVAIAPKSFKLTDDSKAEPIEPPTGGDSQDKIKDAAESCPVTAITITE